MTLGLAALGYKLGPFKTVHNAAGTQAAPTGNAGLDLKAAFGTWRPDSVYVTVIPSEALTITDLTPWSRAAGQWCTTIPTGGATDITHASVAITTAKGLLFSLDLPLLERVAFSYTLDAGNVTIAIAGIYRR